MSEKTIWRLILSPIGASGAWNMALDETFLKSAAEKSAPPTLRLYAWQPATLSLGFAQPCTDVDLLRLEDLGWGLVRRPTGGRAILHVDELTYSVTAPIDDPLLAGVLLESYHKISRALLLALEYLQIPAAGEKVYEITPYANTMNPVCFETPSNYEITAAGKKLIGSAQARKYGGILQHGAIPISGDITRITQVMQYASETDRSIATATLAGRAVNLESLMKSTPDWLTVAEAVIRGFSDSFAISLVESQPTQFEIDLAHQLVKDKYLNDSWTFRL